MQLGGDLLRSADAARQDLSRVVARCVSHRRGGGRDQALDRRIPGRELANARHVESCSASRAVSFSSRTPSTTSSSVPSNTAAGEVAACSKKASKSRPRPHRWRHVEGVRVGANRAQQHPE
eukprot:6178934-Pleurochrysis_carterae.AAC.1